MKIYDGRSSSHIPRAIYQRCHSVGESCRQKFDRRLEKVLDTVQRSDIDGRGQPCDTCPKRHKLCHNIRLA